MDKMTGKDDFITTWRFTDEFRTIAMTLGGDGVFLIDWGDGCVEKTAAGLYKHTYHYDNTGYFDIRITGRLTGFSSNFNHRIVDIKQWGGSTWEYMRGMFKGAKRLTCSATDAPDLSKVTDLSYLFSGCSVFNGKVDHWDVSKVTEMKGMFRHCQQFNQPIGNWTVGQVKNMQYLLSDCQGFQQDLSNWGAGDGRTTSDLPNANNLFGSFDPSLKKYNELYEERQANIDRDVMRGLLA